jgi:hypothetical protein
MTWLMAWTVFSDFTENLIQRLIATVNSWSMKCADVIWQSKEYFDVDVNYSSKYLGEIAP